MAAEAAESKRNDKVLVLFDVDGTLTEPRKEVKPDMLEFLAALRDRVVIGTVGGSDLVKQKEQLGEDVLTNFDFVFPENGLLAFKDGAKIASTSIKDHLGNERLNKFLNFTLRELSDIDIPVKRGTFIEFRTGLINISPIGRNCSQEERDEFEIYDREHKIRETLVKKLATQFADYNLKYSIGGQISFDVFPIGWDKTFCLRHVKDLGFSEIHFFGDKTFEGGNDYEIFTSPDTIGHTTTGPSDTIAQCKTLFF